LREKGTSKPLRAMLIRLINRPSLNYFLLTLGGGGGRGLVKGVKLEQRKGRDQEKDQVVYLGVPFKRSKKCRKGGGRRKSCAKITEQLQKTNRGARNNNPS